MEQVLSLGFGGAAEEWRDYVGGGQRASGKRQQWRAEQSRSADLCLADTASGALAIYDYHIIIKLACQHV